MKRRCRHWRLTLCVVALIAVPPAAAITIDIDYTYDTSNFFAPGSQARTSLQAAADFYSAVLADTFSAITVPSPYPSSVPGSTGLVTWSWQQGFINPSTGAFQLVDGGNIGADRYLVYAGARAMSGTTAGSGSPGVFGWSQDVTGTNEFTQSDINNINAFHDNFINSLETRGESSGFAGWGGAIGFDTSNRLWHFDHTSPPTVGRTDFYSVAIHELAHALGFGEDDNNVNTLTPWEQWVNGAYFEGLNAFNVYGGSVPLAADRSHWAAGTNSVVYGGSALQETAMDPDLASGTRKLLTDLDVAAMKDIGWTVVAPPALYGDYNNNGIVDAADYVVWRKNNNRNITLPNDSTPGTVRSADYTVWRTNFGKTTGGGSGAGAAGLAVPEPAAAWLVLMGAWLAGLPCRQRRG